MYSFPKPRQFLSQVSEETQHPEYHHPSPLGSGLIWVAVGQFCIFFSPIFYSQRFKESHKHAYSQYSLSPALSPLGNNGHTAPYSCLCDKNLPSCQSSHPLGPILESSTYPLFYFLLPPLPSFWNPPTSLSRTPSSLAAASPLTSNFSLNFLLRSHTKWNKSLLWYSFPWSLVKLYLCFPCSLQISGPGCGESFILGIHWFSRLFSIHYFLLPLRIRLWISE